MYEATGHPRGYAPNPSSSRPPDAPARVVLVDDHLLFVQAMEYALTRAGVAVVGTACCREEALEVVAELKPDLVLLDLGLPDRDGIEVGEEILQRCQATRVIALSSGEDAVTIRRLRRTGFHGFLSKSTRVASIVSAVGSTDHSGVWPVTSSTTPVRLERRGPRGQLTRRELEVLDLLSEGCGADRIAGRLGIGMNTVRSHIQSILAKLQVHSRLEAVALVMGSPD